MNKLNTAIAVSLLLAAAPLAALAQRASQGHPQTIGGDVAYESISEDYSAGHGYYTHYLKISLYRSEDTSVRIYGITCNGDDIDKTMDVQNSDWVYVTYTDRSPSANWYWTAQYE